jgi:hypothetical protein
MSGFLDRFRRGGDKHTPAEALCGLPPYYDFDAPLPLPYESQTFDERIILPPSYTLDFPEPPRSDSFWIDEPLPRHVSFDSFTYIGDTVDNYQPSDDEIALLGAVLSRLLGGTIDSLLHSQREYDGELYDQCKAVGDFLHDNEIPNLVLLDRSARPAHVGIRQYMRMRYPDETLPATYFIDPDATVHSYSDRELNDTEHHILRDIIVSRDPSSYGFDAPFENPAQQEISQRMDTLAVEIIRRRREAHVTPPAAVENFQRSQPVLASKTDQPVLVFDTCSHTGQSMHLAESLLRDAGFTDVWTGVVSTADSVPELVAYDLVVGSEAPTLGCHPFGSENAVCREPADVVAQRTPNAADLSYAYGNRQAIKQAVIEFALQDPDIPHY